MFKALLWMFNEVLAFLRNGVRHLVRGDDNFMDKLSVEKHQ